MLKNILKFLLLALLIVFFYYSGTLNLHKILFTKNTQQSPKITIIPTITPYPKINLFDTLREVENGVEYSDRKYGISFIFPQNFTLSGTSCNLSLERFSQVPHSSMWSYIHFGVFSKGNSNSCDWIGHSGQDNKYNLLSTIKIGETIAVSDSNPKYFTYRRLPDEVINKNTFKHYASYKVWESSANTAEHIFQTEFGDDYSLWVMGLTNEDLSQSDSIEFITLKKIITSINIQ